MQKNKIKRRKGMLVLSAFIVSIILLTYWWLGNAWSNSDDNKTTQKSTAFNTSLPDANPKETGKNKLEIYMQAEKDEAKLNEQQKKDSLEKRWFNPGPPPPQDAVYADQYPPLQSNKRTTSWSNNTPEQNEKKVNDRLQKLYAAISATTATNGNNVPANEPALNTSQYDDNIAQLEKMLLNIQHSTSDSNPEIGQWQNMLDKVLDIQHPERVKQRLAKNTENINEKIFTVSTTGVTGTLDSLSAAITGNAFWGLQEEQAFIADEPGGITAVVHQDQLLQDGAVIKLRLLQDIFIGSIRIPKDHFIFGECSLGDQRLLIRFNNIAFHNTVYPVRLTAYDTDGNEGIYIPGAIGRDAAKNGLNDAVQQMQLATLNPSIGAQAATAGIQTAQNLLSKKIRRVQVTVKAGHKVLLKMTGI